MKQVVMSVLVFSIVLVVSLAIGPSVKADFADACTSYGPIPANDNPSRQHINCLLTNAALEAQIPPEVVKGIVTTESGGWKQFKSPGEAVVSSDGGIGLMQITDKTLTKDEQQRLKTDIVYNIEQGIRILNEKYKYNVPKIVGANQWDIENWYFPVLAYNGIVQVNRPVYLATGEVNKNAYQYKVFQHIEKDSFSTVQQLAQWPFSKGDFPNAATGTGFTFKKLSYTLADTLHPSIYIVQAGDQVELAVAGKVRATASTALSQLRTYEQGTILTVAGAFEYDERPTSENVFVWFPIKNEATQQIEYISSANIRIAQKKDVVAPTITYKVVTENEATMLKGTTEKYATVIAQVGTVEQRVQADQKGAFSIALSKDMQVTGAVQLRAIDLAGNESAQMTVSVVKQTAPAKAKVDPINDRSKKITGTAQANATVTARLKTTNQVIGTTKATSKGTYSIAITPQKANATILVQVEDANGNQSAATSVIIKTLKPTVNAITSKTTAITGKGLVGSTVYVKNANGKVLGNATVKSNGTFTIKLAAQKAATKLTFYAKDSASNVSVTTAVTVQLVTPTVNKVTASTTAVTGKADAGTTVKVYKGTVLLGQATVDAKGNFKVKISKQKKGTTLTVTSIKTASLKASAQMKVQ